MGEDMQVVTVSGSFARHLEDIGEAMEGFRALGCEVASPRSAELVDYDGVFFFVRGDPSRDVQEVQQSHLDAIKRSTLLWVASPDGYIGCSASMEIGYARAVGVPVFACHAITDRTLREFVEVVANPAEALAECQRRDELQEAHRTVA